MATATRYAGRSVMVSTCGDRYTRVRGISPRRGMIRLPGTRKPKRKASVTKSSVRALPMSLSHIRRLQRPEHGYGTPLSKTPSLDWQLLTKRPKFITRLVPASWLHDWPAHVWIGTSVGMQKAAEQRIPYLLDVPAPVRFLSCEPLVEPVTLAPWLIGRKVAWVICGGYSGSEHRPMDLAWARFLQKECARFGVAFFLKQLGSVYAREHGLGNWKGEQIDEFPEDLRMRLFPVNLPPALPQ